MKTLLTILLLLPLFLNAQVYEVSSGSIRFHSEAPKELISATSERLRGVIDIKNKTFAFRIGIGTFMGFNSPLQREHFNENYMESSIFPEASFSGKIIEDVDLSRDGEVTVRAKGKLRIHGQEQERIIKSVISVKDGKVALRSDFIVSLADHDIKIPRIVYEKLAPQIEVSVNAALIRRK
ncbi:MAG: YceI family protein [Sphingobacteriales bacterium]|nr:MAG: YceI family protein [Sphingobacteriales bacterium]